MGNDHYDTRVCEPPEDKEVATELTRDRLTDIAHKLTEKVAALECRLAQLEDFTISLDDVIRKRG